MTANLLKDRFEELEKLALAAGLEPYDIHFFEVPTSVIYEVASYGLPTRYSHWSFGRVYQHQKTQGEMGFSKIYELILNNDPSYAFLDKNNPDTINLMIAAHCIGHADVFKNNIMFRQMGEKNMIQVAKRHAETIDEYRKDFGDDEVDEWLDVALALERHIDVYKGLRRKRYPKRNVRYEDRSTSKWEDLYHNTEPLVKKIQEGIYIPPQPEKDLLWFLSEYSNMEPWQKQIFEIVRRESYYFYPQFRTKTINEGWACMTGDSFILTEHGYVRYKDFVEDTEEDTGVRVATGVWTHSDLGKEEVILESISDSHITYPQKTIRLMTSKGISIEGAHSHKLLAASNNKDGKVWDTEIKELSVGDFVQLTIGSDIWASKNIKCDFSYGKYSRSKDFKMPHEIDEDVAKFLGYFLSEGCVVKRGIQITNKDQQIIKDFCKLSTRIFNIEPTVAPRSEDPDKFDCILWCTAIVNFLEYLEIDLGVKSKRKQIPDVIMRSPKKVVAAFLSAYFSGDGGCYKGNRIVVSTSSPNMAEQIALLLLNFGINFSYSRLSKKGYDLNYHLTITGKHNCWLYATLIGFSACRKKKLCCQRIIDLNKEKNYSINTNQIYAKILDISEGFEVLYDITVPETHHYIAQGAINHNSYWHAELMKQYFFGDENDYGLKGIKHPLTPEEHLDFVAAHEKVVKPGLKLPLKIMVPEIDQQGRPTGNKKQIMNPVIEQKPELFGAATRLNPYYVGFKMFRDIKERWDKYYDQGYMINDLDQKVPVEINGDQKIREVMMNEDDVSFFRNYLTEELCDELHLFGYGNTDEYIDDYGIQEEMYGDQKSEGAIDELHIEDQIIKNKTIVVKTKETKDIISMLARVRNNYGCPSIVVRRVDEAGLLRLEHVQDDNINLDIRYASQVVKYIGRAWKRPVELIRKDRDKTWLMRYDITQGENIKPEINYEQLDYPDCLEDKTIPSSW